MLKTAGRHDIVLALLLVGGHSVLGDIIDKQLKAAILHSLAVAGCVLIFFLVRELIEWIGRKANRVHDSPSVDADQERR